MCPAVPVLLLLLLLLSQLSVCCWRHRQVPDCHVWLVLVADGWKEQGPACGLARHTTCACRAEVFRSVSQCNPGLPAVCCLLLCCCVAVL